MDRLKTDLNETKGDKIVVNFKEISSNVIKINFQETDVDKISIKFKDTLRINASFSLGYDETTGKLSLLGKDGSALSEVDLPTEKILKTTYYDDNSKELVLQFNNLEEVRIPIDFTDEIEKAIEQFEITIIEKLNALENVIQENNEQTNQKLNQLETNINQVINEQLIEVNDKIDTLEDNINNNIGVQVETLNASINETKQDLESYKTTNQETLNNKVDKVEGKGLSSNDYTNEEKEKLASLNNYDDTKIKENINKIENISNEALVIAEGRVKAKVFETYLELSEYLKNAPNDEFNIGDNLFIKELGVPDYWISAILDNNDGYYGYYEVSLLETRKVELNNVYTQEETNELLDEKVDKVEGYGLSQNDFTNELKEKVINTNNYNDIEIRNLIDGKVDKIENKQLSTEDYTTKEKTKLSGIEEGANNYVLPSDVVQDSNYVHTDNNFTTTEKEKLSGLSNYDDSELRNLINNIKPNINYDVLVGQETSNKWSGTTIPNDSYVEKVYFNTDLSVEEVVNILSNLPYYKTPFLTFPIYPILFSITGSPVMFAVKATISGTDVYEINIAYDLVNQVYDRIFLSYTSGDGSTTGWHKSECDINSNAINDYSGISIGAENDKITSLVSTTPFVETNSISTLYELNEDGTLNKNKRIYTETDILLPQKADKSEIPVKLSQLENDKGYLTQHQDISNKADKSEIPTLTSQLTNDSGFITKDVDNLTNYELKDNVGNLISVSIDSSTFVMSIELKNSSGTTISSGSIDLPLETMVIGASYNNGELSLVLKNGQIVTIDISAIISGLVPDNRTINGKELKNNITLNASDVGAYTKEETENLINNATPNIDYSVLVGQETVDLVKVPENQSVVVDKIYFNTKLNVDSVNAICETLNYTSNNYYVFVTSSFSQSIMIKKNDTNNYGIYVGNNGNKTVFDSETGWAKDFNGVETFNARNTIEELGPNNVATPQNDKLINLFSITPFTGTILYQLNEDGTLNKNKPLSVGGSSSGGGLTETDVIRLTSNKADKSELFSKDYNDLTNKPTIPTKTSQLTNDSGYLTDHQDISGKVDKSELGTLAYKDSLTKSDVGLDKVNNVTITSNQVEQIGTNATEISSLKTLVSTNETDTENKISNINTQIDNIKKVLSSDDTDYDTLQELVNALKNNVSSIGDLFTEISKKVDKVSGKGLSTNDFSNTYKNKIDGLSTVATSGSYSDLTDTPSLSKGTDTTNKKTLAFGGTFTAITDTAVSGHQITDTTTTYTMPSDRLFVTFTPTGTAIPASADLNTPTYLKVGRYYCSKTADASKIKNCPLSVAFMMEVYSPLSTEIDNETTKTWVYRLRKITAYNTGVQYVQFCNVGATVNSWTYDKWYVMPRSSFTIDSSDSNGGSATVGSSTQPVYVASDGTITKCTYTLGASVPSNAVFTDTTYKAGNGINIASDGTISVSFADGDGGSY